MSRRGFTIATIVNTVLWSTLILLFSRFAH
jgi:hypothetical protein